MKLERLVAASLLCLGAASTAFGQVDDLPKRKPGMWEMQMQSGHMQGRTMTMLQCIDEKTDADMQRRALEGNGMGRCAKTSFRKTGNGYEVDSVCSHDNRTMTSHGVITGDFQSAYQIDMRSRFDPPLESGAKEAKSFMTVRYLGACRDGMVPGDVSMNGMKMNMNRGPMAPGEMKNMSPEDMKKMMEQMKKQMNGG